jgi:hypothetical protein
MSSRAIYNTHDYSAVGIIRDGANMFARYGAPAEIIKRWDGYTGMLRAGCPPVALYFFHQAERTLDGSSMEHGDTPQSVGERAAALHPELIPTPITEERE